MSYKKRNKEEVEAILRDYAAGKPMREICEAHLISEAGFYRLLSDSKGVDPIKKKSSESRVKKLEKIIEQRDKEIALMKAALKKS
jgi:hypothetical protein